MLYTGMMLKLVLTIVVALLVLSFFGVSLQHIVESPTTQANFGYIGQLLAEGWHDFIDLVLGFVYRFI